MKHPSFDLKLLRVLGWLLGIVFWIFGAYLWAYSFGFFTLYFSINISRLSAFGIGALFVFFGIYSIAAAYQHPLTGERDDW